MRRRLLPLLVLAGVVALVGGSRPPFACTLGRPATSLPFCRQSLPLWARVRDLVARLARTEKVRLLVNNAARVPRLDIAGCEWWSEALHGVSNAGRGIHLDGPLRAATSFPQVIVTAASFNPHLWYRIGQVRTHAARTHDLLFPNSFFSCLLAYD